MTSIILITHRGERCGVQQFGRRLYDILRRSDLIEWTYVECDHLDEYVTALSAKPDAVLFNYHPHTMPWLSPDMLRREQCIHLAIQHEFDQESAELLSSDMFDYLLCTDATLVPRNPIVIPVPRFGPEPRPGAATKPDIFTVGSFGFATEGKGFDRLCKTVNDQFDNARIRINIPRHDNEALVSDDAFEAIAAACRAAITKSGIKLETTRDFLDNSALLDFLSENTLNAFLYDPTRYRGISSCIDYALACGRPVAVSQSAMFRNVHKVAPSICIEKRSLYDIAASGLAPLRHHIANVAPHVAGTVWNERIAEALRRRKISRGVPDARGFNKILDDRARNAYTRALADLKDHASDLLSRKIVKANIQQAFALDTTERLIAEYFEPRILAVGSYEDTTVAVLRAKGYEIEEIDPDVNGMDLRDFVSSGRSVSSSYDVILCVSVLEHVEDDGRFVRTIADLLAPGGVGIFTVDFSNAYPQKGRKPFTDHRLFTTADLRDRLMHRMPDCALVDVPSWDDGEDEFHFEGCDYAFASWVFRKFDAPALRYAIPEIVREQVLAAPNSLLGNLTAKGRVFESVRTSVGLETNVDGLSKAFAADGSVTGFLLFGPYCSLPPGVYQATFLVSAVPKDVPPDTEILIADLTIAGKVIEDTKRGFTYGGLAKDSFAPLDFKFAIPDESTLIETRLFLTHHVAVSVVCAVAIRLIEGASP